MSDLKKQETGEKGEIVFINGKQLLKYRVNGTEKEIAIENIKDIRTIKKRKWWLLVAGLLLIIISSQIPKILQYGGQLNNGLLAILCILGVYLIFRCIIGINNIIISHTGGEVELKIKEKKERQSFLEKINKTLKK